MIESQEERIKVLGIIYYLIEEKKIGTPFFQDEILELLPIDEKDLALRIEYLYQEGYIDIKPTINNFIIYGITSRGVDFIEDPFRAEGVTIISSNVNTANINADHAQMKGKGIEIIQQNTTNIFNTNRMEIEEQVKNLEEMIKNIELSDSNKLKNLLEEANKKLEAGDRTSFVVTIKNFFSKTFEELKPKSFNAWLELIVTTVRIAKLLA